MNDEILQPYRSFLKDTIRKKFYFSTTDQNRGIAPPPIEKPFSSDGLRINLLNKDFWKNIAGISLLEAIQNRKSHRTFLDRPLKLDELSFLLWATQGIRQQIDQGHAYRTVPSAGCRHALETYLCILNVEGLDRGIYRYLPQEHQLLLEVSEEGPLSGQPYPTGWNGGMDWQPIRSLPWMPVMSVRIFISLVRR